MKKLFLIIILFSFSTYTIQVSGYTNTIGIEENDEVNLHYILTYDGEVQQDNPDFTTIVSNSRLIEGFYLGLLGMYEGQQKNIVVPPDKGYPPNHDLGGKTLYFDVTINEIVNNIRGDDYVPPVETEAPVLFDFAAQDNAVQDDSVFQDLLTSPLVLAFSITGLVVFAYIKFTGNSGIENVVKKKPSTKLTAQEKLRKRMQEVDKKEY